ncbi:hypothetical protein IWX46DRAFT_323689, partial [Phyllosticta citricarpa]
SLSFFVSSSSSYSLVSLFFASRPSVRPSFRSLSIPSRDGAAATTPVGTCRPLPPPRRRMQPALWFRLTNFNQRQLFPISNVVIFAQVLAVIWLSILGPRLPPCCPNPLTAGLRAWSSIVSYRVVSCRVVSSPSPSPQTNPQHSFQMTKLD